LIWNSILYAPQGRSVHSVFKRNKIPLWIKVLACLLYLSGLSYRRIAIETGLIPACYRSVHYWAQKLRSLISNVQRRYRRIVAVGGTKLKVNGKHTSTQESQNTL